MTSGIVFWAVFGYLSFDLAGCWGLPAEFVRIAKTVCWLVGLFAWLFGRHS